MNAWKPYLGRLICTALGLICAVMFLVLGFFKTILIILCCAIGYAVGVYKDKGRPLNVKLPGWLLFWKDKW